MKLCYPVSHITSLESFNERKSIVENYPISRCDALHGGVYIEGAHDIRAIADGEIVAFRTPEKYTVEEKDDSTAYSSNGFVLIRHQYEYVSDRNTTKKFVFYSLYHHLLPYRKDEKETAAFEGREVPDFLKKEGDVYEITANLLNFRSSEKSGTQGKVLGTLSKGTKVQKAPRTKSEQKDGHWTNSAGNAQYHFQKISCRMNGVETEGFIATGAQYAVASDAAIDEYDVEKFPFDVVCRCSIPVKSGDKIGYSGLCDTATRKNVKACHFGIFTIDEQELKDFINGSIINEEKQRHFFLFKQDAILQKTNAYAMATGRWEVQLLAKGNAFSKIQIIRKKKQVLYDDLIDNNNNTYSIAPSKLEPLNAIFDGVLKQEDTLDWVETIKDADGNRTNQRIAAIKFAHPSKIFWIANEQIPPDKKENDAFELTLETLYVAATEPTEIGEIEVAKGTEIAGYREKRTVNGEDFYYLKHQDQWGWLKDDSNVVEKRSAHKWTDWGFEMTAAANAPADDSNTAAPVDENGEKKRLFAFRGIKKLFTSKKVKTEPETTALNLSKEAPDIIERKEVLHFHPIAFIAQMKRIYAFLGKYLTIEEAVRSATATSKKLDNNLSEESHWESLKRLGVEVYDPIYDYFKGNIKVNSCYRSPIVNTAVGGSKTSQHCKGQAIDIDAIPPCQNREIIEYALKNMVYDQLIWEYGDNSNPDWAHVSIKESGNRVSKLRISGSGTTALDLSKVNITV